MHVEETLLEKMWLLWDKYQEKRRAPPKQPPKHVILYTGLSPCPTCTEAIIEQSRMLYREKVTVAGATFAVAYTYDWKNKRKWGFLWFEGNEEQRDKLIVAGIGVQCVPED